MASQNKKSHTKSLTSRKAAKAQRKQEKREIMQAFKSARIVLNSISSFVFFATLRLCVRSFLLSCMSLLLFSSSLALAAPPTKFFEAHCVSCHDASSKKGDL